jgi:hypothetical protein
MMACAIGWRPPPPTPCRTREIRSIGSEGAIPQRKLAAVKIMMQSRKKFLRPMTFDAHAPTGRMIALETR